MDTRKNKKLKERKDNERINLFDSHELKHWATQLGVTQEDIEYAVYQVGDLIKDIKEYLNKP